MVHWDFDTVVVGAGVIGLAVAAAASARGQSVLALERGARIGEATSSRNSEVIHAGIYYPTGSLKHQYCVSGRRMLYNFMEQTGVDYHKCGKLIVATSEEEEEQLARIHALAEVNGIENLQILSGFEVRAREPEVSSTAAIYSPETGVFDSHGYMMRLLAKLEAGDGLLALRSPFAKADVLPSGFRVWTEGAESTSITTRRLVNAAGLWAPDLAQKIEGIRKNSIPQQRFAKGCYFSLSGRSPFSHLIYPVPVDGGLGVHATLDLAGATRFGPDVAWLPSETKPDAIDYNVPLDRIGDFEAAIRRYWPGLRGNLLQPDYSGVRPKLRGPGEGFFDFEIQSQMDSGVPGLVNLYGFESPGLTASLAVGDAVATLLGDL